MAQPRDNKATVERRKSLKIGDRIRVKVRVSAMYSLMYEGTPSAYPEQWLETYVTAVVSSIHCADIRRNTHSKEEFFIATFPGTPCPEKGITKWRSQIDYQNIEFWEPSVEPIPEAE